MIYYTPIGENQGAENAVDGTQSYEYKVALIPRFDKVEGFEDDAALTYLKKFSVCVFNVLTSVRNEFFNGTARRSVFGKP